MKKIDSLQ